MTIFSFAILFAACSSDDKNDPTPPVGTVKFDGVFKGDLAISMGGQELDNSKNKIEIIKTGEGKATLQLKNFKFQILEIGDIIVKDVVVTEKDKVATLKGEANLKLEVGDCVVVVDATVEGDKLIAEIHVDVTSPLNEDGSQSSKMKIKVNFDGNRFDGVESSEAKLLSFNLKDIDVISSTIDGETVTLFIAKADGDKIKEAQPVATFSEKATISPSLDKKQDFTEPVVYTVTAEDGITTTKYTVKTTVSNIGSVVAFDFSKFLDSPYINEKSSNISHLPDTLENFYWGSSDGGMVMVLNFDGKAEKFGVTHVAEDNDFGGPVFRIETLNTVGQPPVFPGTPSVPKITSGSLFLGNFKLNFLNPLKSTSFGVVVKNKPLVVSGTLSYASGDEYYHCPDPKGTKTHLADLVEGKKDEGIISAVVYEVANANETLDGTNIYNSPKVIATSSQTFSHEFKGDFTFDIEYSKDFDPAKTYKLAIMLSASKDGDKFSGAGGSVLKISKLEVGFE